MKTLVKAAALFAFILVSLSSCNKENVLPESVLQPTGAGRVGGGIGDIKAAGFDVEKFADLIEARLNGKVPGYGYRIWVNGVAWTKQPCGGGKARYSVDSPARDYTATVKQDIGSCAKFMTALLVMKVLERNGKTMEEKVWPYFPSYFKPSSDFKNVTFRDLMAHTSGVVKYNPNDPKRGELWDVQESVEKGITDSQLGKDKTPVYNNMNYGILRVALPYLVAKTENSALALYLKSVETNNGYDALNEYVATMFRAYLRNEVFKPAGLANWDQVTFSAWGTSSSQFTKYYSNANPTQPGANNGNYFLAAGSGGLYLSADEIAQVVAAARQGKIVKPEILQQMKTGDGNAHQLGFDDAIQGSHGRYYHKNGAGDGNAVLFDFDGPVSVQLAITTNMRGTEVTSTSVWAALFDQAWN